MGEQLSVFIVTLNEAERIGRTLDAIAGLSSDVIVVDSGSTDATVEIAREKGVKVVHRDWSGYGPQKRHGESLCRHDWVLNIDADEVVTPELAREIGALMQGARELADAYRIRIVEVYPGETKPAPFAYGLDPVRLYRRSKGSYAESAVHDRVMLQADAKVGVLRHRIDHFSVPSMRNQIDKLLRYADAHEAATEHRSRRISSLRMISEFPLAFLKAYFGRRHFMRGAYGYAIAVNYAYYRHIRIMQLYERNRLPKADDI
ncbi:MAG: glycosyltransferase family 2 protein [Alphaproteobacteria bacterium]|nr:glycosyltransferase family 2 protein [Alphaproteobacteria bacterium]